MVWFDMSLFVCLFDWVDQSYLRLSGQDSRVLKVLSPPLQGDWDFLFKIGIVREKLIDNTRKMKIK